MPRHRASAERSAEADRLVALRTALGMSQRELATEFEVTSAAVSQWEAGVKTIPGPVLRLIALYERELAGSSTVRERTASGAAGKIESLGGLLLATGILAGAPRSSVGASIRGRVFDKYVAMANRSRGLTMKWAQFVWAMAPLMKTSEQEALRAFYAPGPIMSAAAAARVFADEFGTSPLKAFEHWEPRPFASASVGQVHRATLWTGEKVAVKIQSPDAAERMASDLEPLRTLESVALVFMRNQRKGVIHEEFRSRFLEECDYRSEAENQAWMRETIASNLAGALVPALYPAWCSRRVLTSAYVAGQNLDEYSRTATPDQRDAAGDTLWRFFHESTFAHGVFNADPNPGNFLFTPNAVAFLDFGRVKRLSPEFRSYLRRIFRAMFERDEEACKRAIVDIGYVKHPSNFDFGPALRLIWSWAWPSLVDGPFAFTPGYLKRVTRAYTADTTRMDVDVHPDMALLPQVLYGLAGLLTTLGAKVRCRESVLPLVYEKGESTPPPYSEAELQKYGLVPSIIR